MLDPDPPVFQTLSVDSGTIRESWVTPWGSLTTDETGSILEGHGELFELASMTSSEGLTNLDLIAQFFGGDRSQAVQHLRTFPSQMWKTVEPFATHLQLLGESALVTLGTRSVIRIGYPVLSDFQYILRGHSSDVIGTLPRDFKKPAAIRAKAGGCMVVAGGRLGVFSVDILSGWLPVHPFGVSMHSPSVPLSPADKKPVWLGGSQMVFSPFVDFESLLGLSPVLPIHVVQHS